MENAKRNEPEKYNVLYLKGKYQYKSKYPQIDAKHKIVYAGPVEPMASIWDNISDILRKSERVCTESRRELKKLEKIGFLISEKRGNSKTYYTNKQFILFKELQSIVLKSQRSQTK